MKGIYKGFKYITQIFVVKEEEIEIGFPTDVKHVAHIGWDGPSGTGPSWMNEFKNAPDFSTSIGSFADRRDTNPTAITSARSTQDYEETSGSQETGVAHHVHKKPRRKKIKTNSSPKSSTRHPRSAKSKATAYTELEQPERVAQDNHSSTCRETDSPV